MCGAPRNGSLTPRNLVSHPHTPPGIHGIEESSVVRDWIDRGRAEGLAEGLANSRRILLKLGTVLIGPPSTETIEAVGRIGDPDRITALSDRLPSAKSWDELLAGPGSTAADAIRADRV